MRAKGDLSDSECCFKSLIKQMYAEEHLLKDKTSNVEADGLQRPTPGATPTTHKAHQNWRIEEWKDVV